MAVAGHTPLRRCRVCRTQTPKRELTRWILSGGQLLPDPGAKAPGRGYYSCKQPRCELILPRTIKKK